MIKTSICTIGDEILIGQIVDTNSSHISRALGEIGVKVDTMLSIPDDNTAIIEHLTNQLNNSDLVIVTGGLGPTKDDITKEALKTISGSKNYKLDKAQEAIVHRILKARGLDVLDINLQQAMVPENCSVITNELGTAPIMAFHFENWPTEGKKLDTPKALYAMPGVPFETLAALPKVINDIKQHFKADTIIHKTIMTYGIAESALSKLIEPWENSLPKSMHLAYLPNPLTGVRLRLSMFGEGANDEAVSAQIEVLKPILGDYLYADYDTTLQATIGAMLRGSGKTLSAAESCTGGEISHLITTVPGSSEYYLGSVTSYAIAVKEKVLGVPAQIIEKHGVVSSEVAAAMAEGVRKLTSSTYSVSTTGLAGPGGDDFNPEGTVWVGVSGPHGTETKRFEYHADRERNIERFAASALDFLRKYMLKDLCLKIKQCNINV